MKIKSYTNPRENIFSYSKLLIKTDDAWKDTVVIDSRQCKNRLLLKIKGIDSPERGRCYMGTDIATTYDQLPVVKDGQYYLHELLELNVVNLKGVILGRVLDVIETAANDILVLGANKKDKKQLLIPLVKDVYVKKVDLNLNTIYVDWPWEE